MYFILLIIIPLLYVFPDELMALQCYQGQYNKLEEEDASLAMGECSSPNASACFVSFNYDSKVVTAGCQDDKCIHPITLEVLKSPICQNSTKGNPSATTCCCYKDNCNPICTSTTWDDWGEWSQCPSPTIASNNNAMEGQILQWRFRNCLFQPSDCMITTATALCEGVYSEFRPCFQIAVAMGR